MTRIDVLIGLLITLVVTTNTVAARRRVDCTKFVFAPVCRGIAAKRAELTSGASSDSLDTPLWRNRERLSESRGDFRNIVDSPSRDQPVSLSDLLMALSKMDSAKTAADRNGRLESPGVPHLTPEREDLTRTVADWLEDNAP